MEEIANEYLKTKSSSWEYYVDTMQSFNDISLEKVEAFIQKVEINLGKKFTDYPMQVLQKYGLIRDDKITFGGYLLFVKEFCSISGVQAGRFKTSTDIIDSISLNTDIFTETDELMIFLRKHFMVEYTITGNPQREERYDYPLDAIREIVLNMIIHRDYRDSRDSIIKIFDDRIEFYNPGNLYDGITIKQLVSNTYVSKTRNKLIALVFKECGLIEKYGSGIDRIKRLCKAHRLNKPKFEEIHKGFRVTVYKEAIQNRETNKKDVGVNQVLNFIRENGPTKTPLIARHFNVTQRTIEWYIKQLKNEGEIEFPGAPKTGGYFVK